VWLIVAMVCLLAAPWVQLSVSAGNGWPHNALRHYWLISVISCHFRDCKALLDTSLTHVSGAIASVQTFTFYIYLLYLYKHNFEKMLGDVNKCIGDDARTPAHRTSNCIRKASRSVERGHLSQCRNLKKMPYYSASASRMSLKSDNQLLSCGQKRCLIWQPSAITNFKNFHFLVMLLS